MLELPGGPLLPGIPGGPPYGRLPRELGPSLGMPGVEPGGFVPPLPPKLPPPPKQPPRGAPPGGPLYPGAAEPEAPTPGALPGAVPLPLNAVGP
jgi:hypothetical protein